MLFKKSMNQGYPKYSIGVRLSLAMPLLLLLTSCATFVPGIDRTEYPNSSAEVGPLVTVDEQFPANEQKEDSATSANQSTVEPEAESPEPISKSEPGVKPNISSKPEPAKTVAGSKTASSSEVKAPVKVKPSKSPKAESPAPASPEPVAENENIDIAIEYGSVAGKVVLTGEEGQQLPATGTMITLTPKSMMHEAQNRPPQVHIIDMEDKTYQPRYSTIHAGDQVVFVNKDNIRHNVFSLSENNAFDLGTYGAGLKRAVSLKEPGIVKIYCNIHPEMATFVAVGNQGLSVKADDQGRYHIGEVLPGAYEVTVWNIRGETKRIVEVKANKTLELVDRIDTTAFTIEPHKNKFGGNYSKNSTLFEDEFY